MTHDTRSGLWSRASHASIGLLCLLLNRPGFAGGRFV